MPPVGYRRSCVLVSLTFTILSRLAGIAMIISTNASYFRIFAAAIRSFFFYCYHRVFVGGWGNHRSSCSFLDFDYDFHLACARNRKKYCGHQPRERTNVRARGGVDASLRGGWRARGRGEPSATPIDRWLPRSKVVRARRRLAMSHSPFPRVHPSARSRAGRWRERARCGRLRRWTCACVRALLMTLSYTTRHAASASRERRLDSESITAAGPAKRARTTRVRVLTHGIIGTAFFFLLLLPFAYDIIYYYYYNYCCYFLCINDDLFIFVFVFQNAFCQRILSLLLPFDVRVR